MRPSEPRSYELSNRSETKLLFKNKTRLSTVAVSRKGTSDARVVSVGQRTANDHDHLSEAPWDLA